MPGKCNPVFGQCRADLLERTVGRRGCLRDPSDLYWAGRNRQMHLCPRFGLQHDRGKLREYLDPCHLFAGCTGMLLPVVGIDLLQRSLHWSSRIGIVLHERLYGCDDGMFVEHEPSDLFCREQRLHQL